MVKKIQLKADRRSDKAPKAKDLRLKSIIPGVIYGPGGESENIMVKKLDIERALGQGGETHLIELTVDSDKMVKAIIKDVQKSNIRGEVTHVDFYRVDMNKEIEVDVLIRFVGEAKAVKDLSGTLIRSFETVTVSCLPGKIPEIFEVSLEPLKTFDDVIRISDVKVPEGVEILHNKEEVIASVVETRVVEEPSVKVAEAEGAEKKEAGEVKTKEGQAEKKE